MGSKVPESLDLHIRGGVRQPKNLLGRPSIRAKATRSSAACGPTSPHIYQGCSISHRLAEIVLVGLRMDQKTQVDVPQEQFVEARLRKAFDEVSYSFEKILGEVRGDSNLVLAKQAVSQLQISLNQFENLLKDGGSSVDSCDSI